MEIERITLEPRQVIGVRKRVPIADLPNFFDTAFTQSYAALTKVGLQPAGPALALYRGDFADVVDVTGGFPVGVSSSAAEIDGVDNITVVDLPVGPAISCVHTGSYDSLAGSYTKLHEWMKQGHITPGDTMWEEYVVGPDTVADPVGWQTRIVYPVA